MWPLHVCTFIKSVTFPGGSIYSACTAVVEPVEAQLNAMDIDEIKQHIVEALENEYDLLLSDIEYFTQCLEVRTACPLSCATAAFASLVIPSNCCLQETAAKSR